MAIPAMVVEEHHEAFLAWNYAVSERMIPASKNTLLHIDEHADMGLPHLRRLVPAPGSDLRECQRFTYNEISIYEFITTAVYQGLFDRLYWIQRAVTEKQARQVVVSSHANRGKALRMSVGVPEPGSDGKSAVYFTQTVRDGFAPGASTILDIDLDYFSCDQAESRVERLEISETEYWSVRENPYHFLRINQGNRVEMKKEGGRFFLYLKRYEDQAPCPLKVNPETIFQRIDELTGYLKRHSVLPRFITIARSRFSGYTPIDQWQFIEENLMAMLRRLYDLEQISLADIAPEPLPAMPKSELVERPQ
jgi:hypothetical protein